MKTLSLAVIALMSNTSGMNLNKAPRNVHLTGTYILNVAITMLEETAKKERSSESETNTHYVKELDKELLVLNEERKHVLDGEHVASLMLGHGNGNHTNSTIGIGK